MGDKMPLPSPRKNEDKKTFINRCMKNATMNSEFPDEKQRSAVCYSQWRNKNKSMKQEILSKLEEIVKSKWTTKYINSLPDSSFALVEPWYGKTTDNKNARHLPYKDANGKIDEPHLRNALARINQVKMVCQDSDREALIKKAKSKLTKAAKSIGIEVSN